MPYVTSEKYFDTTLQAPVHITVRSSSRSLRARVVGSEYRISVPPFTSVETYLQFISQINEKLGHVRETAPDLTPGTVLEGLMLTVKIFEAPEVPKGKINIQYRVGKPCTLNIYVSPNANPDTYRHSINKFILKEAKNTAIRHFIPLARIKAEELGLLHLVKGFSINTNSSNYGLCSRDGRIAFSSRLIFMPPELQELIICHELAHLTHHDHSPAFHALLDSYLHGRERALARALRRFRSPLF